MCVCESGVEKGSVWWRQGEICPSFLFPVTNILGENINIHNAEHFFGCTMQLTFMYNIGLLYAYFLNGRLRVWCGGHIISSCGGST